MIAAFDLRNSGLSVGFCQAGEWLTRQTIGRPNGRTADEYAILLRSMLEQCRATLFEWEGAILSSVVPRDTERVMEACERLTGMRPILLGPGVKSGIKLRTDTPSELGTDLVAQAVSAHARVSGNLIILDEDEVCTLSAINAAGEYRGTLIFPGPELSLRALRSGGAQLPEIGLKASQGFIGKNNVEAMGSGIMQGYAGAVAHLIEGMRAELGGEASLARTSRAARSAPLEGITEALYDQWLCLDGLLRVFQAQAPKK